MVGQVEAHQLLLQPQLFGGGVIGHRSRLGGGAQVAAGGSAGFRGGGQQVKQVALAAGPVAGAGGGPVDDQIQVGHQLGAVGLGLEAIEGTAVHQRFQGAAVEGAAGDAVAQVGQGAEWAIGAAGLQQGADGAIAEVAHGGEAKQDPLTHGGEVDAGGVDIGGHHLNAHGVAVGDVALHLVGGAGVHREQGGHVGHRVVGLEVGGLVSHRAIGGGMALVEAVFGEQHHLLEQRFGDARVNTPLTGTLHEDALVLLHLALFLLAHGAPQQVGFTEGVARQVLGDAHDLLLVDHDSVGLPQDRLQLGVGEVDGFAAVFAVDEFGDQPRIEGARSVEGEDRGDVLQGGGFEVAHDLAHAA